MGNAVHVDGHSARQTHHVGVTEGVVAQVAALLVRHRDGLLPLFQLQRQTQEGDDEAAPDATYWCNTASYNDEKVFMTINGIYS